MANRTRSAAAKEAGEGDAPQVAMAMMSEAAPLEPPERAAQREPASGHPHSTTNHVAANAALRSVPGSTHEGLVDDDGNPVNIDDVFEFPGEGNPSTIARVTKRVYERFRYPNTDTMATHLLYREGADVPLWQAHQLVARYKQTTTDNPPAGS